MVDPTAITKNNCASQTVALDMSNKSAVNNKLSVTRHNNNTSSNTHTNHTNNNTNEKCALHTFFNRQALLSAVAIINTVVVVIMVAYIGVLVQEININKSNIKGLMEDREMIGQGVEEILSMRRDFDHLQEYHSELEDLLTLQWTEDKESAVSRRKKRSPETLRRPSRYMKRPVPIYNKAYGINLKEGEGLQLYSSLQGPLDSTTNSVESAASAERRNNEIKKSTEKPRRPLPASFLKNGVRRKRPQLKSLPRRRENTSLGGLVVNRDALYKKSLYKNTPGDDDWNAFVSKVQQGGASSSSGLSQAKASAPVYVTQSQRNRPHRRPRKKNSGNRRRRRSSRITAAHFNGLPAVAGTSRNGMWEGAEWMDGLGLTSRYKTGGDHVQVTEPGIYLIYAQVKYTYGRSSGFDVKVNGRSEASCSQQLNNSQPTTCHTSAVVYLPKNSVVRVESDSPNSPVLALGDGEQASMGLVKLLEAPDSYHKLFKKK